MSDQNKFVNFEQHDNSNGWPSDEILDNLQSHGDLAEETNGQAAIINNKFKQGDNTIVICFCYRIFIQSKQVKHSLWDYLIDQWLNSMSVMNKMK